MFGVRRAKVGAIRNQCSPGSLCSQGAVVSRSDGPVDLHSKIVYRYHLFDVRFLRNETKWACRGMSFTVIPNLFFLGWKKSFEKMNTQMTREFMVISQLLGGQF